MSGTNKTLIVWLIDFHFQVRSLPSYVIIDKQSHTRLIVWSCLSGERRNMSEWTTPCSAERERSMNQPKTNFWQCCRSMKFWYGSESIRGSIPLTNGSRSCYFRQWTSRRQQKINCAYYFLQVHLHHISSFFAYYFLKVHLHRFSKIKSQ